MRKKTVEKEGKEASSKEENWINVEQVARVEITSEDPEFPIEEAFSIHGESCWKASESGSQTIRIIFDEPQEIRRIHLLFQEEQEARTHEFVLRVRLDERKPFQEIVRQQYTFSPGSSTKEEENYKVELKMVKIVEMQIVPDIGDGNARASVSKFWIA